MTIAALLADPLLSHLLEILADPASEGLILAGGFGLRLKQEHLRQNTDVRTLIPDVPAARATQDLDFFLRIELWTDATKGSAVRVMLDRLGYQERVPHLKFARPLDPQHPDERLIKVDLLARTPREEEKVPVRRAADPTRHPSRVGAGSGVNLHGGETPEAFAVEDSPLSLPITGAATNGTLVQTSVRVPHLYAWLNMKVKAAADWTLRPKPFAEKHAFDVYLLDCDVPPEELAAAEDLARRYASHPMAVQIREDAARLYGEPSSPGFREAERQAGGSLDHELFYEALKTVLGISSL